MKKNKKIFLGFSLIFLLILLYISYDFATKTTFPGRVRGTEVEHEDSIDLKGDTIPILENTSL